jgi:hypothetical protein
MNAKTLTKLQYFVDKVCSVFTGPINRSFDEVRAREHFVVRVREIDIDGLWGMHPYNHTVSFFPLDAIKLITEEVVLDPNNPDHARMIKEYQEKTGETIVSDISPHLAPQIPAPDNLVNIETQKPVSEPTEPAFVNIKHLDRLAKDTSQTFAFSSE